MASPTIPTQSSHAAPISAGAADFFSYGNRQETGFEPSLFTFLVHLTQNAEVVDKSPRPCKLIAQLYQLIDQEGTCLQWPKLPLRLCLIAARLIAGMQTTFKHISLFLYQVYYLQCQCYNTLQVQHNYVKDSVNKPKHFT